MNVCSNRTVGPRMRTASISATARTMLNSDNRLMPASRPAITDAVASDIVTTTSTICTHVAFGTSNR